MRDRREERIDDRIAPGMDVGPGWQTRSSRSLRPLTRAPTARQKLRRESLAFRDALDLDRDRVERLLHPLEPRALRRQRRLRARDRGVAHTLWRSERPIAVAAMQMNNTIGTINALNPIACSSIRLPFTGSTNRISVPAPPTVLSADTAPSCASTVCRAIARPSPVPPGLDVTYGSQMRANCSRGMPHPVSDTATSTASRAIARRAPDANVDRPPPRLARVDRVEHHVRQRARQRVVMPIDHRNVVVDVDLTATSGGIVARAV